MLIAGAVLQGAGLALLLADVAASRAREFGKPAPWTLAGFALDRVALQLRKRLLHRDARVQLESSAQLRVGGSVTARGTVRPGPGPDLDPADRLANVERYLMRLHDDINWLSGRIGDVQRAADAHVTAAEERIRGDLDAADAARKAALHWSHVRQVASAVFITLGLALGTWGIVA